MTYYISYMGMSGDMEDDSPLLRTVLAVGRFLSDHDEGTLAVIVEDVERRLACTPGSKVVERLPRKKVDVSR